MCRLLESISVVDGVAERIPWHQQRMDAAAKALWAGKAPSLQQFLSRVVVPREGHHKLRIEYAKDIENYSLNRYTPKRITSLRVVYCDNIHYDYKFANRTEIDRLYALRDGADDILIVRNGLVTDTSYCNVLFYNGLRWVTPLQPLLKGTMREYLLDHGWASESEIFIQEVRTFKKIKLINALLGLSGPELAVSDILF